MQATSRSGAPTPTLEAEPCAEHDRRHQHGRLDDAEEAADERPHRDADGTRGQVAVGGSTTVDEMAYATATPTTPKGRPQTNAVMWAAKKNSE